MAEINDLSTVDASNTARFPENQAPSTVNNGARALEGIIARWNKDTDGSVASTGSSNAYVVAANQTLSAYYDGLTITFDANFSNTAAATLNVDSVSADSIVWPDGTALREGDIQSGAKITVRHDGTNWQLVAGSHQRPVPNSALSTGSGTSVDTTSIADTANLITIVFDSVSTNGTSVAIIQIGTGGSPTTSGYTSGVADAGGSTEVTITAGFPLVNSTRMEAAATITGEMKLMLANTSTNAWVASWNIFHNATTDRNYVGSGRVALAGSLDIVRLTTANGTDAFDSGNIRVLVE